MIITLKNQAGTTDTFDTSTTINAQSKQYRSNQPALQKSSEQNAHYLLTTCIVSQAFLSNQAAIKKITEQNAHYLLTTCAISQHPRATRQHPKKQ